MKRIVVLTSLLACFGIAALAGPLKVVAYGAKEATYPVRHPMKTGKGVGKAVKGTTKATGKTLKFILW